MIVIIVDDNLFMLYKNFEQINDVVPNQNGDHHQLF